MWLEEQIRPAVRVLTTNSNDAAFPSKVPTITEPINDGVYDLAGKGVGLIVPQCMKLWFIGLGANNDAFSVRILGWTRIGSGPNAGTLWFPTIIAEFTCVMGNFIGVAGSPVLDTEFFADTIAPVAARIRDRKIAAGTSLNSNYDILSPANDTPGHVIMPIRGFEKLEFIFDQTINTPTMNVLMSLL